MNNNNNDSSADNQSIINKMCEPAGNNRMNTQRTITDAWPNRDLGRANKNKQTDDWRGQID